MDEQHDIRPNMVAYVDEGKLVLIDDAWHQDIQMSAEETRKFVEWLTEHASFAIHAVPCPR